MYFKGQDVTKTKTIDGTIFQIETDSHAVLLAAVSCFTTCHITYNCNHTAAS